MALRRVFTYLGAVFLMSHIIFTYNAGAIALNIDLNNYEEVSLPNLPSALYDYTFNNTSHNCTQAYSCTWYPGDQLRQARTHGTVELKKGDVYTYQLYIYSQQANTSSILNLFPMSPGYGHNVIGYEQIIDNNTTFPGFLEIDGADAGSISSGTIYNSAYQITVQVTNNVTSELGSHNQNVTDGYLGSSNFGPVVVSVRGFQVFRYVGSQENKEQAEATQDSVDQSQQAGSSSQSDAQTGTASLISTIGSAVSAITSASPTNCVLNGNMGNFDMGQIDLCANPVPAFVQIISSLILILITVPLCIVMFNRFIGLFRSFQG